MINVDELKLGNWIMEKGMPGIIYTVHGITDNKVMVYPYMEGCDDEWLEIDRLEGILLTDEWNQKLGMKLQDHFWTFKINELLDVYISKKNIIEIDNFSSTIYFGEIKFVHQFQSLVTTFNQFKI